MQFFNENVGKVWMQSMISTIESDVLLAKFIDLS